MISTRTKAALAAAKAQGVSLGEQRGSLEGKRGQRATVRRGASAKRNEDLLPVIEDIRASGASTPQQIADGLNERGITPARGGAWSAVQVRRILEASIGQKADARRVTEVSHKLVVA